jgi:23S rRNA (adenine2503-C2)-methyltransferase
METFGASAGEGKLALQGLIPAELAAAVPDLTLAEARRVVSQVHRGEDYGAPGTGVRRGARAAVAATGHVPSLEVVSTRASQLDPFVKLALRTADGHVIETVRIPLEQTGRFSVCVSSQVGCALACAFCATGRMGLRRNLEAWEIVEQVRLVRRTILEAGLGRVHGVVFQGMGEPLANLDRVLQAIRVLNDPSALAIDARGITVCTSGLPAGIRRLAVAAPKVRLGWSIGSALREVRLRLMPIERAHGTEEVFDAVCEHAERTGLSPLWALTLLAGENDREQDAHALADLVDRFRARTGRTPRLSVIPYNAIVDENDPFRRTDGAAENAFRDALRARGVFSHKRYSGGSDVAAACGQLAARA